MDALLKSCGAAVLLAVAPFTATGLSADERDPVVVELFTSQGCSSCPPADRFAGELAERDDVVVLSFHVDYWDYIGWEDPFATPETTNRQRAYAQSLGLGHVYTPQMVIDGRMHEVGSDRSSIEEAIRQAKAAHAEIELRLEKVGPNRFRLELPAADIAGSADILMVQFDYRHETQVASGENRGRAIVNYNVVRDMVRLGTWTGEAQSREFEIADFDPSEEGCAILVQIPGTGPILAGTRLPDA